MAQILGFAVVAANGTVLSSSGVSGVEHFAPGRYRVSFGDVKSLEKACAVACAGAETLCWAAASVETSGPGLPFYRVIVSTGAAGTHGGEGWGDAAFQLIVVV
jgi:hypothetical protein